MTNAGVATPDRTVWKRISHNRLLAIGLVVTVSACGGEALELAPWRLPVPAGAPVREYAAIAPEDRPERIELEEDLVVGDSDDLEPAFYSVTYIDVDSGGRIYAFDAGNVNVQVFGPDGTYLLTIGREGQGPGEFPGRGRIAVAGNRLVHVGSGGRLTSMDPALRDIRVDGHGHLYVFSFVPEEEAADRTVDVYSAAGELIFAGRMTDHGWQTALGDHVYSVRTSEASGEREVVRHRLVEPFPKE